MAAAGFTVEFMGIFRKLPIRVLLACPGWPCGLLEVGSWARRRQLAEVLIYQVHDHDEFRRRLAEFRPHVVGLRIEGGQFEAIRSLVAVVREACDAEVVLGGPSATSCPREVLEASGADYVFAGEAEETFAQFLELARRPDSRHRAAEIPGLAYGYGGRTYHNTLTADGYGQTCLDVGARCRELRIAARPAPDERLLAANRLDWSLLENFSRQSDSLYFTAGRGCPGACTFCDRLHGQELRQKIAAQLMEEIAAADVLVARGELVVGRWKLFAHTDVAELRDRDVAWAAVYDEDFFLGRRRAIELFELWEQSPLKNRYRLSLQTNPCSLLLSDGRVDGELMAWIDRLKPMVQLGAESFHPEVLARWRKRHTVDELTRVIDALDGTSQDYGVFVLLTDYETTPEELVESLRRLVLAGLARPRMRVASSPYTIPLYDAEVRKRLEFAGRLCPVSHFTDYERPHPEWMDPLVVRLADLADSELRFALQPEHQPAALARAMEVVLEELAERREENLHQQAARAMDEVREARFQPASRFRLRGGT